MIIIQILYYSEQFKIEMQRFYVVEDEQNQQEIGSRFGSLNSIKQAIAEEEATSRFSIPSPSCQRVRNLLLRGLIDKKQNDAKKTRRNYLLRWYINRNNDLHKVAINRLVIWGPINQLRILYLIKIAHLSNCQNNALPEPVKHSSAKPQAQGHRLTKSKQKYAISIKNMVYDNVQSSKGDQKQNCNYLEKEATCRRKSRRHMVEEVKENSIQKESISFIEPTSGELMIELATCTNLFQHSEGVNKRRTAKTTAARYIATASVKLGTKLTNYAFRKILENMIEGESYQEQLLQARRNLEVIQENFLVQCQINTLTNNCDEQNERLESIQKAMESVRQKELCWKLTIFVKCFKKIVFPRLKLFYTSPSFSGTHQNHPLFKNTYQIHELDGFSQTSLSIKSLNRV